VLFTSLDFFLFLPVALALFALLPPALRWAWLLLASWLFYGWSEPRHLLWLGAVTLLVWLCATALGRTQQRGGRMAWLAAGVGVLVGSLVVLKFHDFAAAELEAWLAGFGIALAVPRTGVTAPAGYSFYVFSAVGLLVDTFQRRLPQPAGPGTAALYLAWFPKVFAGPIEPAPGFLQKLRAIPRPTPQQVLLGSQLIGWGLVKKVLIADNLAPLVDRTFGIAAYASPVDTLISIYFFAFQIYCDFSGYTDIAIGASLLFGLPLVENFRRPYFARSPGEFWSERWHISLGRWFRDYLYIPLGGSRRGAVRHYLNLMLVFIASGLWHAGLGYGVGWTFLAWGALNGAYVCAGAASAPLWKRLADRLPRVARSRAWLAVRVLVTFHLIALGWLLFRAKSLHDAWLMLERLATRAADLPTLLLHYPYGADHQVGAALIAVLVAVEMLDERRSIFQRLAAAPAALRWSACYVALFALLLMGRWQGREFIYMQF